MIIVTESWSFPDNLSRVLSVVQTNKTKGILASVAASFELRSFTSTLVMIVYRVFVVFATLAAHFVTEGKTYRTCELARALAAEGVPRVLISNCNFFISTFNVTRVKFNLLFKMFALRRRWVDQTLLKLPTHPSPAQTLESFKLTPKCSAGRTEKWVESATSSVTVSCATFVLSVDWFELILRIVRRRNQRRHSVR